METISQIFQSPAWWISTVVVALIINLLSNRLSRIIDKQTDEWSEKRQKKLAQEKADFREKVESLSKDPTGLIIAFSRANTGMILVTICWSVLMIVSFIAAIYRISESVSLTFNLMFTALFYFLFVFALAMARNVFKNRNMCRTANALRIKRLLEEKEGVHATASAKRGDDKSVSRS